MIKSDKIKETKKKPEFIVQRHKTAIARYDFSKPVKSALEHNLISKKASFFDYGCGQGGDLKSLQNMGINASGWDPEFQPDNDKVLSDVVNLGFVLNIIEDQIERAETLQNAYDLTQKLLIVSCMIATASNVSQGRPYKDGILTNRGTFQKYFSQNELRQYIEDVLGATAVAVAPGVFYVFRNPIEQQDFLSKRNKRHINWDELSKKLYPARPERKLKKEIVFEENRELIESFWEQMLELGRIPKPEEFENIGELKNKVGSPNFVKKLFLDKFGEDTINEAFEIKRNDLLVYLALSNFKTTIPFKHLSINLQADIKTFVGSYVSAIEESKKLLFSIGNHEIIESLCAETEFGFFDFKALYIHKSLLQELSPILRIYIGCAGLLYGDLQNADIIKIHKRSGKVTLLCYDDFENKPLPELLGRIKINLRKQKIDIFDHQAGHQQQLLCFKENYVSKGYHARLKWEKYSKKLRKIGFDDNSTIGTSKQEFFQILEDKGLTAGLNKKRTNK